MINGPTCLACNASRNTFTTTRGHNGADDNDDGGNKNTCVKWRVTHKPRADISHRRQRSLAAQRRGWRRGGELSAPSNEVDAKYVDCRVPALHGHTFLPTGGDGNLQGRPEPERGSPAPPSSVSVLRQNSAQSSASAPKTVRRAVPNPDARAPP